MRWLSSSLEWRTSYHSHYFQLFNLLLFISYIRPTRWQALWLVEWNTRDMAARTKLLDIQLLFDLDVSLCLKATSLAYKMKIEICLFSHSMLMYVVCSSEVLIICIFMRRHNLIMKQFFHFPIPWMLELTLSFSLPSQL